jgi:hypothetical protein
MTSAARSWAEELAAWAVPPQILAVAPPQQFALIDAARERARSTLRAEAEALAADEQDRAEAAQVLRDMESLRAW